MGVRVAALGVFAGFFGNAGALPQSVQPTNGSALSDENGVGPIRIALTRQTSPPAPSSGSGPAHVRQSALNQSITSTAPSRRFGCSLAVADIDGDGFLDLFVGQSRGASARNPGVVFAFRGAAEGLSFSRTEVMEGARPLDLFGLSVATVGDVNGDGLAEVLVGAPDYGNGQVWEGAFFLIPGKSGGGSLHAELQRESGHSRVQLGMTVAAAGDVNRDGFADVLVGAPRHAVHGFQQGVAFFYFGSPTGLVGAAWAYTVPQSGANCGDALAGGDFNGDGYSDVLVGIPGYDAGNSDAGRVALFLGSKSGLGKKPDWSADGPHSHARFGAAVAAAGDLNGDGFNDVLIGAPGVGDTAKRSGWVYAYYGSRNGLAESPAWSVSDGQDGARFGTTIATVGDVNGDRRLDVVIGAPGFDGLHADQGRACLFLGTEAGLSATPDWTLEGGQPGAECGDSVAALSDLNRDGLADFAVGSPRFTGERPKQGRVDLFFGSTRGYDRRNAFPADGTNLATLPRQRFSLPSATSTPASVNFAESRASKRALLVGAGVLVLAAGVGRIVWRRRTREMLEAARTEERARIARDLHDRVGPHLARLDPGSGPASGSEGSSPPEDIARALEQVVWATDPGRETLESLVSFLAEQGELIFARASVRCRFDLPEDVPPMRLPAEIREHAVPCVLEAFANVLKHAAASEVWLRVRYEAPWLTIEIEDDGKGLSGGPPLRTASGDGIRNMGARAKSMRGELAIAPGASGGTRVTLRAPIAPIGS